MEEMVKKKRRRQCNDVSKITESSSLLGGGDQSEREVNRHDYRKCPFNRLRERRNEQASHDAKGEDCGDRVSGRERVRREVPHIGVIRSFRGYLFLQEAHQVRLRIVLHLNLRIAPDCSTRSNCASVHLVILRANQSLVEKTHAFEQACAKAAIRNRIG